MAVPLHRVAFNRSERDVQRRPVVLHDSGVKVSRGHTPP